MVNEISKKICVVILNYNGWQDTIACLESVLDSNCNLQVVVVDNGSTDDSVKKISTWTGEKKIICSCYKMENIESSTSLAPYGKYNFVLIETAKNLGFAAGNNAGIRYAIKAGAEYIFVLNNDTKVERTAVSNLVSFLSSNPEAALAGPRVLDFEGNYWQYPCFSDLDFFNFLFSLTFLRHITLRIKALKKKIWYIGLERKEVYSIPGSAMMFKAAALEGIGLFDEKTFLFYEEFIIAEKLKKNSLKTFFVPEAIVRHKWSGAINKLGARKAVEYVKSEKYFVNSYLKFKSWEKGVLVSIRFFSYIIRVYDKSYRKNFKNFMREL